MRDKNSKNKIFSLLAAWVLFSGAVFWLLFPFFQKGNSEILERMSVLTKEKSGLVAEKAGYELAKKDLEDLSLKSPHPDDFFSRDTTLVEEIRFLESLGQELNLDLTLGGISGTIKPSGKNTGKVEYATIPYNITAVGEYNDILSFLDRLENMPYVTSVNSLSFSSAEDSKVSASIGASFYLRK